MNGDRAPQLKASVMFLRYSKCLVVVTVLIACGGTVLPTPLNPKCGYETPVQMLKRSSVVFTGRVSKVISADQTQIVTLTVTKSWKGARSTELTLTNVVHHESAFFREGDSYLVFAQARDGSFSNGPCSGTVELKWAGPTIRALNRWQARHRSSRS
jgi:hypothetical protein